MANQGLVEMERGVGPKSDHWKWEGGLQTYGEMDLNNQKVKRR